MEDMHNKKKEDKAGEECAVKEHSGSGVHSEAHSGV
jgi:hypothetical protein